MASVTGLTAARMIAIEAGSVVDGDVVNDILFLTRHDGSQINAGNVRGQPGTPGLDGDNVDAKAYSDDQDALRLAEAKAYAAAQDLLRLADAKAYSDGRLVTRDANPIVTASSIKAGTTLDMGGAFYQKGVIQPRLWRVDTGGWVTNATGQVTFTHGCPFTPTSVICVMRTSASQFGLPWGSSSLTATQCTFRWINASTANSLNALATGAATFIFIE